MDGRKRKFRMIESSEEQYDSSTGVCSIEWFNAAKDPFRVAPSGKIPVPWPFGRARGPTEGSDIIERLDNEMRAIIKQENIGLHTIRDFRLYPRLDPERVKDTIIVYTGDTPSDPTTAWKRAANRLYELLNQSLTPVGIKFRVEIRNSEYMYRDVSRAVRMDLLIRPQLVELQPKITTAVKNIFGNYCTSIAIHMRGPMHDSDIQKPTVLVTFQPGTRLSWALLQLSIETAVQQAQASLSMDFELPIELIPGAIYPSAAMQSAEPIFLTDLKNSAQNGASIGPRNSTKDAGSLGAWVIFQPAGKPDKYKCFLTCYHVIASGDPENRPNNDNHGIGLNGRPVPKKIVVDYPAPFDSDFTMQAATSELENNMNVENNQQVIETINRYKSYNGIGFVMYASGYRRTGENRRLDWALVALNPSIPFPRNICPLRQSMSQNTFFGEPRYDPTPNEAFTNIGDPEKGRWIAKMGRTSGVTCGEVTTLRRIVFWNDQPESMEVEVVTLEARGTFARGGDSGAMVFNAKKEWVGMVLGADPSADTSIITASQQIVEDIRTMTGGTITLA